MKPRSLIRGLYGILPDNVNGIVAGSGQERCHGEEWREEPFPCYPGHGDSIGRRSTDSGCHRE
jgi:hypothetical protein